MQWNEVRRMLVEHKPSEVHHGDCIGADADFHQLSRSENIRVVIHPPVKDVNRAFCNGDVVLPPKPYITRDDDIIDAVDVMIATPKEYNMILRSGTWTTVRHARKKGKTVFVILPDGTRSVM